MADRHLHPLVSAEGRARGGPPRRGPPLARGAEEGRRQPDQGAGADHRHHARDLGNSLLLNQGFEELTKKSLLARFIKLFPSLQSLVSGEAGRSYLDKVQLRHDTNLLTIPPRSGILTSCSMYLKEHFVVLNQGAGNFGIHTSAVLLDPIKTFGTNIMLEIYNTGDQPVVNPMVSVDIFRAPPSLGLHVLHVLADDGAGDQLVGLRGQSVEAVAGLIDDEGVGAREVEL